MQMSEELDKLKKLQEVLAEKYQHEAEIDELPKKLEGDTAALDRFKKEFINDNADYETERQKISALKVELSEVEKGRENAERGMDGAESNRDIEILEKQIQEFEAKEDELRETIKKEEKKLSELNDKLKTEEENIANIENDVNSAKSDNDQAIAEHQKMVDQLGKEAEKMAEGIDPETIIKFERILHRNRKGIVAVRGNVCEGCHMILPAQFANEVHKGEKILFCPYCSRILFYEESGDDSYYSMDDAGSLADLDDDDLLLDGEPLDDNDDFADDDDSVKSVGDFEE